HTIHLRQIIAMHGQDPEVEDAVTSTLSDEILHLLRRNRGDQGVVSAVREERGELREQYNATLAAVGDPERGARGSWVQKRDFDFAERVLRQVSRPDE